MHVVGSATAVAADVARWHGAAGEGGDLSGRRRTAGGVLNPGIVRGRIAAAAQSSYEVRFRISDVAFLVVSATDYDWERSWP